MASTTFYYTSSAVSIAATTADEEVVASETAPGSGSLVCTKDATNTLLAGVTPSSVPNNDGSWNGLAAADCQASLDISSNSGLTLLGSAAYRVPGDLSFSGYPGTQSDDLADTGWSSTTGTGVKTYTAPETIDLGATEPSVSDRYMFLVTSSGSSGSITVDLGSDSWFEIPWAGPFITLYNVAPTDDVTTTGWSSTPLWSKIDEDPGSPDATVITATAS